MERLMDLVTSFLLGNSKIVAILIVIVAAMALAGAAGQFMIEIVSKFKIPIGVLVVGALIVGAVAFLK